MKSGDILGGIASSTNTVTEVVSGPKPIDDKKLNAIFLTLLQE